MKIPFGAIKMRRAYIYEIESEELRVGISDFGAAVQFVKVRQGNSWTDVCPGFDDAESYAESGTYLGATVGRVANRISGAAFTLGGKRYNLSQNDGANCHHGGAVGFDKKFFTVTAAGAESNDWHGDMLELTLESPDGDMGFPGNLRLKVRYSVSGGRLSVEYAATSDKDTLWAPTCHTYFNLDGASADGDSCGNMLKINADCYTPVNKVLTPTGTLEKVFGTPFDFTGFHRIEERIGEKNEQLWLAGGYDHNFALNGEHAATAYSQKSGIKLDIYTDMPGLHLYSGNFLRGRSHFGDLKPRAAYALEAQYFPDAANIPSFRQPILRAGQERTQYIRYIFGSI